jgi:integrase
VRKTWARALKTAKVATRPIYDLRATFASRLSAAGEPDNFVAGMLGHSSTTSISILPIYAKVVDEFLRGAIQKLETLRNSHSSDEKQANSHSTENRKRETNWVN